MWIKKIRIKNFRNYKEEEFNLENGINVFFGENAQGKTNIIEAIYLSAIGKSFRTKKEKEIIKEKEDIAEVELEFEKKDRNGKIKVILNNKKNIFFNGIKIKKLSELLSNLNIVIFTPDDINILKGNPQKRRRFLDIMIGQLRPNYIYVLNSYLKVLDQRNIYLRQIKENGNKESFLDIWDEKLVEEAEKIYKYRKEFLLKISKEIKKEHREITKNKENLEIEYISDFLDKDDFFNKIKERRKVDILKGYTTKGIHRDDFVIYINGKQVNVFGSQGQNRTVMLSLKLAEINVIRDELDECPVLLLDDFMSELDKKRIKNFFGKIKDIQVIITCTEKIDIENFNFFVYNVKDGKVYKEQ